MAFSPDSKTYAVAESRTVTLYTTKSVTRFRFCQRIFNPEFRVYKDELNRKPITDDRWLLSQLTQKFVGCTRDRIIT